MSKNIQTSLLAGLSDEIAGIVERTAPSIVRVDDGTRLTATGLIWSEDGLVITTSHGVERDEELAIVTAGGGRLAATLIARDPESDLALLRTDAKDLAPIARAEADSARAGEIVLALASPGHAGLRVTLGIVTARLEAESDGRAEYVLLTDADMRPGFSGGALANAKGELVGMINLSFRRRSAVALGTPLLAHVVEDLLANGPISRGYVGISTHYVPLPETLRQKLSITQEHGLLISHVASGSPAEQAGLVLGDVALSLDGQTLEEPDTLRRALRSRPAGQTVAVAVLRGGERRDIAVTLAKQPE
jgi:S1-C subfamily serine protease